MGCVSTRPFIEDTSRPVFHVWNIDDQGKYIRSCRIQVTDTELVLHQRGESPIIWPLTSLRRYGFDSHLFSFECGRRCATGPGIYAFKCKRAESLFNTLQECLQASYPESEQGISLDADATSANGDVFLNGVPSTLPVTEAEELIEGAAESGYEPQPCSSTAVGGPPVPVSTRMVVPTAPQDISATPTRVSPQKPTTNQPGSRDFRKEYSHPLPLPRCCIIGTCINTSTSSWHRKTQEAFKNTTCGSCRTCSLNMCVVQPSAASAANSVHRARQADYGNVLDTVGHPRQCVHCCCGFKPSTQQACSADNCPLHFNNSVDQITNYARLDDLRKQEHTGGMAAKTEKNRQHHQVPLHPVTHLYMNMPTPTKKWPTLGKSRSVSWRSLPHFGKKSSLSRLPPKRSTSHFYANVRDVRSYTPEKKPLQSPDPDKRDAKDREEANSEDISKCEELMNYVMLDLEKNGESCCGDTRSSGADQKDISPQDSEGKPLRGYATIDFEKTTALSNSANGGGDAEDESVRRTRHNGSITSVSTQTS